MIQMFRRVDCVTVIGSKRRSALPFYFRSSGEIVAVFLCPLVCRLDRIAAACPTSANRMPHVILITPCLSAPFPTHLSNIHTFKLRSLGEFIGSTNTQHFNLVAAVRKQLAQMCQPSDALYLFPAHNTIFADVADILCNLLCK